MNCTVLFCLLLVYVWDMPWLCPGYAQAMPEIEAACTIEQ